MVLRATARAQSVACSELPLEPHPEVAEPSWEKGAVDEECAAAVVKRKLEERMQRK